ncbi:MAG: hypothetical protein HOP35_01285 [Nitrospira sp.]|nr:hypothetical protein [Nitrospira sp.]
MRWQVMAGAMIVSFGCLGFGLDAVAQVSGSGGLSTGTTSSSTIVVETEEIHLAGTGVVSSTTVAAQVIADNQIEQLGVIGRVLLQDAFHGNAGIVNVNQEAGNVNNQANVRVLAFMATEVGSIIGALNLAVSQNLTNNTVVSDGGERSTRIANSFGNAAGIVGVNQTAGNANNQLNVLGMAVGDTLGPDALPINDTTLGQVSSGKRDAPVNNSARADVIENSFSNFRGIAQVNQSSGDLNSVGNVLGVSFQVFNR